MPSARIACKGCTRPFPTLLGYRAHIKQTTNPLCVAVRRQLAAANRKHYASLADNEVDSDSQESSTSTSGLSDTNSRESEHVDISEPEPCSFGGDFFGGPEVYEDEFFGQEDDEQADLDMGDSEGDSDIEGEITAELEDDVWEPVRGVTTNMPLAATTINENLNDDDEAGEAKVAVEEMRARKIADEIVAAAGHGVKPASTVRYSEVHRSSKVGQILVNEQTADERYQRTVGQTNPWDPLSPQRPTGN